MVCALTACENSIPATTPDEQGADATYVDGVRLSRQPVACDLVNGIALSGQGTIIIFRDQRSASARSVPLPGICMGRGCSKTIIRIILVEVKLGQNEPAEVEA
jgi:hypothetical protein